MNGKLTKKAYEAYLNDNSPVNGSAKWIISGTARIYFMWKGQYGSAIRQYDPIAFQVGYNEWVRENQ